MRVVDAEQIEPRLRKVCQTEGATLGFKLQAMFQSVTDELDFGSYSAADGGTWKPSSKTYLLAQGDERNTKHNHCNWRQQHVHHPEQDVEDGNVGQIAKELLLKQASRARARAEVVT